MHWGATYREGQTPLMPAGPGWFTSAEGNWETGEGSTVTPLTAECVQVMRNASSLQEPMLHIHMSVAREHIS